MTASEPLTLDEEYDMQLSWKEDPKKCTFIVLALEDGDDGREAPAGAAGKITSAGSTSEPGAAQTEGAVSPPPPPPPPAATTTASAAAMAGDVNLFFNDYDDPGMCEVRRAISIPLHPSASTRKKMLVLNLRFLVCEE